MRDKYAPSLAPCCEMKGEWRDDYVHLEYWQRGSYAIPDRKPFYSPAIYEINDRIRYFDLCEYQVPQGVSDLITITKTYEFTGITEFHVRWYAHYDEIQMTKEYDNHSAYKISNYAYALMQRSPKAEAFESQRFVNTGVPKRSLLPAKEPEVLLLPEEPRMQWHESKVPNLRAEEPASLLKFEIAMNSDRIKTKRAKLAKSFKSVQRKAKGN